MDSVLGANATGELISNSKRSIKSGGERTGGDDSHRTYVRWPQELCMIGPEHRRVKYDDLTHVQWVASVTAMAAKETNPAVQVNMVRFLSALHHDVFDYSFVAAKGALCLILCVIEENKVSWDNLPAIQALRENYIGKSQEVRTTKNVEENLNCR